MNPTFQGKAPTSEGTSINFNGPAPAVKWLFNVGYITPGSRVLDYGAGKYDRNAIYLRSKGVNVYSYDPFHGSMYTDGWDGVASSIEEENFDFGLTSFVLNVITDEDEDFINYIFHRIAADHFHVIRTDIPTQVKAALLRKDPTVTTFFTDEFGGNPDDIENDTVIEQFCHFGTATSRGFQRVPQMIEKGFYQEYYRKNAFAIYSK